MTKDGRVYPYVPNSVPHIKAQMLKEVGAADIMDLYAEIPDHLRLKAKLKLPEPILDEYRNIPKVNITNPLSKSVLNVSNSPCLIASEKSAVIFTYSIGTPTSDKASTKTYGYTLDEFLNIQYFPFLDLA